jgi:hypothetical protein
MGNVNTVVLGNREGKRTLKRSGVHGGILKDEAYLNNI